MKRCAVVGAGQLGTACALALAANGCKDVRLLCRDTEYIDQVEHSSEGRFFHLYRQAGNIPVPESVHVSSLVAPSDAAAAHALVFAVPCTAFLPPDDLWAQKTLKGTHTSNLLNFTNCWVEDVVKADGPKSDAGPLAVVLSRGLTADGEAPHRLLTAMLREASAGRREVPVVCGTGPIMPKEWAVHATPALDQDGKYRFAHPYSPTSLTFAVANDSLCQDAGLLRDVRQQLTALFARESVTLLEEPDSADLLGVLNACLPLCSFGAGLVSNAYAGNNVGALAAYFQHACSATEALLNTLLGRASGSPLPPAVWSSLSMACTTFASREFVLGRQLDYHFKKFDAIRAVYSGPSHAGLAATVDGVHTLLQKHQCTSPFYEVLMDAYNTHIRASVVGEGLVKEGYYDYREAPPSPLLREITKVDDALFSGDGERFERARKNFEKVFSGSLKGAHPEKTK